MQKVQTVRLPACGHCVALIVMILMAGGSLARAQPQAAHFGRVNAVVSEKFVRKAFTFGSFGEVHSPTIARAADGTLVAAYYGGSEEGEDDQVIYLHRFNPVSQTWGTGQIVHPGTNQKPHFNPVLFQPSVPGTPLILWYKINEPHNWRGVMQTSTDGGQTWSAQIDLPASANSYFNAYGNRFMGPTKNKPLERPDGSLLLGASSEASLPWRIHIEQTPPSSAPDYYKTGYTLIGPLTNPGVGGSTQNQSFIQPAFLHHDAQMQHIQMIARQYIGGPAYTSHSLDGGQTWGAFSKIVIDADSSAGVSWNHPDLGAGIDAVTLTRGPEATRGWHIVVGSDFPGSRHGIGVAVSEDGQFWKRVLQLDFTDPNSPTGGHGGRRMEYPSVFEDVDGMLHIVYTAGDLARGGEGLERNKYHIKHVVLDPHVLI
ncbi:MAG TPA: exo-alpha-sialidase, partial [Tepidisphaeraceae bacterium]|nr:exo-alpha-sialidase [Tepidisphaeraceae bacterium]